MRTTTTLQRRGFTLMLGAGASLSSGVKPLSQIVRELVDRYRTGATSKSIEERFDRLWQSATPETQAAWLDAYRGGTTPPSTGYRDLARLIKAGFFDRIVTFNYDGLLESALQEEDFHDYSVVVRGENDDGTVAALVRAKEHRVKILQLHGGLQPGPSLLFSANETISFPEKIANLVRELTARDILVCGYAFADLNVMRAFAESGGAVYCINPAGAPRALRPLLASRECSECVIDGENGDSDRFFAQLAGQLVSA